MADKNFFFFFLWRISLLLAPPAVMGGGSLYTIYDLYDCAALPSQEVPISQGLKVSAVDIRRGPVIHSKVPGSAYPRKKFRGPHRSS